MVELFGGSEKVDQTMSTQRTYSSAPCGGFVGRDVPVSVFRKSIVPGSDFEGWIVRVISAGKVVRMEASLQELKLFAEKEAAALDRMASEIKAGE